MNESIRWSVASLSWLLYALALLFPGFYVVQGDEPPKPWIEGYLLLLLGPFGLLQGQVSWLANPLLFWAWYRLMTRRYLLATILALVGLVFAASFFLNHRFYDGSGMNTVARTAAGYWLWLVSLVTTAVGALACLRMSRK